MIKRLVFLLGATLAFAAPAWATAGGGGENAAQTSRALSLQALALLEQGRSHEAAMEKLDQALASGVKGEIDLRAIRAAHAALHEEDVAAARRLLQHAFPGKSSHVVGVTFRPQIRTARLAVGIAGGFVFALAVAGLVWRRRTDARRTAAGDAGLLP